CVTTSCICFFFNDTSTTEIYTLSLHDALPIFDVEAVQEQQIARDQARDFLGIPQGAWVVGNVGRLHPDKDQATLIRGFAKALPRSEEHTSELQSRENLVCRLLLEKKKKKHNR